MPDERQEQDEIAVLWRGEDAIRALLEFGLQRMELEQLADLRQLLAELTRIRGLRVQRQMARRRAKQRKRAIQVQESREMNAAAKAIMQRASQRDHQNGSCP